MKKIIALFCCIAVLLCGCGKATDTDSESKNVNESVSDKVTDNGDDTSAQQNDNEIKGVSGEYVSYLPVLKETYSLIVADISDIVANEGQMGIVEMIGSLGNDEALKSIGYVIKDINNDNIPELIIASVIDEYDGEYAGSRILSIYTLIDKEPSLIIEGMYRDKLFLKSDGTIYNIGSGGAAYTAFGVIELRENGGSNHSEYYYSDIDNETGEPLYYKSTGLSTADSSKESVSRETFFNKQDELSADLVALELTSFYDFKNIDYTITDYSDVQLADKESNILNEGAEKIKIRLPQLIGASGDYTAVNNLIKQEYEDFISNEFADIGYFHLTYEITYCDSSIICIQYEYEFMGETAAHPVSFYNILCISLDNAGIIDIDDNVNIDEAFIREVRTSINENKPLNLDDDIILEGLREYFDVMTDEEFTEAVLSADISINDNGYYVYIPLPHATGVDYIKVIV